ncbi:MAG: hypothetical protein HFI10_10510 [Lachnospiraceae bacterium]|jgi:hypothetical protein|nr:hypothetical protein [Lachnospiraceae bacterium]
MSLTVQMKPDHTSVITRSMQKLGSNGGTDMNNLTKTMLGGGGDNTLIDYTAIKNGSYGKLLKAYYSEVPDSDTKKAVKNEKNVNKKVELVQDAINGKSSDSSKTSTDTTYNAMADKVKNLSESVSTLFNESI